MVTGERPAEETAVGASLGFVSSSYLDSRATHSSLRGPSRSSRQLQAYCLSITLAYVRQFKDEVGSVCIEQSLLCLEPYRKLLIWGGLARLLGARAVIIGGGKSTGHKIAVKVTDCSTGAHIKVEKLAHMIGF